MHVSAGWKSPPHCAALGHVTQGVACHPEWQLEMYGWMTADQQAGPSRGPRNAGGGAAAPMGPGAPANCAHHDRPACL